ncbi:unnamed protein product [Cladocopium goreaui]|uniref:Protein TIC 20-v, chloroplastic n=1 Tax=Cladocopium goreaui TaxID=2562237 RepID=A0A9P1C7L6_9DINO|nr:unnamed protein product [Cladocopium goreaui]
MTSPTWMRRNASHLIHQRAAQIEEHLRETKLRHLQAREVLANSLGALANLVTLRWARLSVTSFHGRLGKCCCEGTGCEWQSFDFGGAQMDYECKLGFSDYLDVLNFNPGAEGAALSKSTAVDDILDQCSKKVGQSSGSSASTDETQDLGLLRILPAQGWPYPSMEWSPPSQPSLPAEAQTAPVEALLKLAPSEPMVVEVSEVVKPQGHTTSTEPEGETPAVDLDLETVTDSVKDSPDAGLTPQTGVEFPHSENRETVKRVEDPIRSEEEPAEAPASPQAGEEAESDSLHALNQAAQQLAEAEQAVSKPLAPPGEALPEAAAPAAGPEQDIPFPRTEALTRTPQIEQEPEAQEISRLQKKQSFKANAGAAANAAENALKNEVQKADGVLPYRQVNLPGEDLQRSVRERPRPFVSSPARSFRSARTAHQEEAHEASAAMPAHAAGGLAAAASALGLGRIFSHRMRQPVQRAQSPFAEVAFGAAIYWTVRAAAHAWVSATDGFALRDDLFQDMAVAHTYKNSIRPWIQSGIIALISSVFVVFALKEFIRSMKEWEQQQEMKEMQQMGEDALFLMSTPVDATPLEKKKDRMRKRLTPLPMRILGGVLDKMWLLRVGACVGYLLPFLNALDFGEISISLYPYAVGVPPTEPLVNFMQHTLKMRYLYNAYLKSGYYFLIVWFIFIQTAVRNKAAPFYVRFHSSQAILISMLLGVPQQVEIAGMKRWRCHRSQPHSW